MPTKKQLEVFIDTFMRLNKYEAEQRLLTGWGVFRLDENLPIPEVNIVLDWLRGLTEDI